jgi:DnaK suppressor protein
MTNDLKAQLKLLMETEWIACKADIVQREKASAPVAPDKALGRLTRMESLNDRGVAQVALQQALAKRDQLQKAREKIDEPGFGTCIICKKAIPFERLMALPESTRCVACAS